MVVAMDKRSETGAEIGHERGMTIVEVIVATMLLTVGVLAVLSSMGAASKASAVAEHRSTAVRVATTEIETMRSWPYDEVGIRPTSRGRTPRFESRPTVSGNNMRAQATGSVDVAGVTYDIVRHVTWSPVSVKGSTIPDGYKLITVVVAWSDTAGRHEMRQDTGLYRPAADG